MIRAVFDEALVVGAVHVCHPQSVPGTEGDSACRSDDHRKLAPLSCREDCWYRPRPPPTLQGWGRRPAAMRCVRRRPRGRSHRRGIFDTPRRQPDPVTDLDTGQGSPAQEISTRFLLKGRVGRTRSCSCGDPAGEGLFRIPSYRQTWPRSGRAAYLEHELPSDPPG